MIKMEIGEFLLIFILIAVVGLIILGLTKWEFFKGIWNI